MFQKPALFPSLGKEAPNPVVALEVISSYLAEKKK
jgi:hypothetical protein